MTTATLRWTDPTSRTDGSALAPTDIARVDVFDTAAVDPSSPIGSVLGGVQTFITTVLAVGTHTFTVVVTDTTGHVSAASNTATVTVAATLASPNPVADLTAALDA